jgi:nucleoside-diphosphate-sugar epimerase
LGIPVTAGLATLTGKTNIFTRATLMALDSNQQIDCTKAGQAFDYQPRPFRETIFDTLAWFSEHGYLPARAGQ